LAAVTHGNGGPYCFKVQYEFEYCSLYHPVSAGEKLGLMLLKTREMAAISLHLLVTLTGENPTLNAFGKVSSLFL
jgi:hypothetical protein